MNVNMLEISVDRSRRQRGVIPSGSADFDGFNEASCFTIGGKHHVPHVINISRNGWGEGRKQNFVFYEHTLEIVIEGFCLIFVRDKY